MIKPFALKNNPAWSQNRRVSICWLNSTIVCTLATRRTHNSSWTFRGGDRGINWAFRGGGRWL